MKIPRTISRRVRITFLLSDKEMELISRLPDFEAAVANHDDAGIEDFGDGAAKVLKMCSEPGDEGIWERFHDEVYRIWKTLPRPTILDDIVEAVT